MTRLIPNRRILVIVRSQISKRYVSHVCPCSAHCSLDVCSSTALEFTFLYLATRNAVQLLVVAFREFSVITDETLASERRRFRQEIVQEIELFARRSAVRNLKALGHFTKDQV